MARFQIHLITEPRGNFERLLRAAGQAVRGGVDWVQLRDKSLPAAAIYRQAQSLRAAIGPGGARLSINDRLDVALACRADGVHLAGQSLPVSQAVMVAGARLLVGRSVHSLEEACQAAADGADYLTFGHVFPTASKPGLAPRGVDQLAGIVRAVDVPVLAIGGINLDNLDDVLATGCAGIALISAVLSAPDPGRAAADLRRAVDASPHRPRRPFDALEESRAFDPESATV